MQHIKSSDGVIIETVLLHKEEIESPLELMHPLETISMAEEKNNVHESAAMKIKTMRFEARRSKRYVSKRADQNDVFRRKKIKTMCFEARRSKRCVLKQEDQNDVFRSKKIKTMCSAVTRSKRNAPRNGQLINRLSMEVD